MTTAITTGVRVFLPAAEPFDFAPALAFLHRFPAMTGEQGSGGGALTKAVREAGTTVGVRVRAAETGVGVDAELVSAEPLTPRVVAAVSDRLTAFLGLRDDLTGFYAAAEQDPGFAPVVRRLHGYHHVRFPSPVELLCWAILSQRCPLPTARAMKASIVAHFANTAHLGGEAHTAFPDLDQLSTLGEAGLAELIGNQRKAGHLHRALRGWAELDEESLRTGDYDTARESLLSLPGIGPWSATFLLVRGLGRMERIAPDREGLRAAASVYRRAVSEDDFTRLAAHYGVHQGYWAHYLRIAA
ncbi:DNA-3-methyladenine glycosylase family protein [Actinokineospora bangkokensis]|uniref:DNA-(apurinic or apyrimidinic site) lyase n=1 Tax=Actinokineospora bangkokensis TaxID=1193682 RepID=A0A1Q9LLE8_9PSEU|nr:DNA-3-methyladenine glycosylase [Actinokineospora bangkokensis]OLR92845.1 DNA-3-methyladenine glycosylase [Actinokineospora bangkokensis]